MTCIAAIFNKPPRGESSGNATLLDASSPTAINPVINGEQAVVKDVVTTKPFPESTGPPFRNATDDH